MSPDCSSTAFSCSLLGIIAYCLFPVLHKKQVIKTSGTITQTLASSLRVSAEPHQQPSSRQLLLACQSVSVSLVTFSGFLFYSLLFFRFFFSFTSALQALKAAVCMQIQAARLRFLYSETIPKPGSSNNKARRAPNASDINTAGSSGAPLFHSRRN